MNKVFRTTLRGKDLLVGESGWIWFDLSGSEWIWMDLSEIELLSARMLTVDKSIDFI